VGFCTCLGITRVPAANPAKRFNANFPAEVWRQISAMRGDRPLWLSWALDGMEPAREFSKFKMGMAAITRKLESLVRPIIDDAAVEAEAEADDADGDAAAGETGYFAPNPSTA